jgi:hypothetical protein
MERPKQQALAFLLGALLVGGVLGFSAERVFRPGEQTPAERRTAFYDDIEATADQRPRLDSILDARNCRMDSIVRTIQPALDSIKAASRVDIDRLLSPRQHARIEVRRKEEAARHSLERQRQRSLCTK